MKGSLNIVGLGPGPSSQITQEVEFALMAATDIVGYGPYVARAATAAAVLHASDNRVELERAHHALDLAAAGRRVVVASSGDPGVFAMAAAVFEALETRPADHGLDIHVLPGVTAMLAAAARIGAPLGHDFCAINLSDNLKPWALIEKRLRLAAEADFAMAFYNPRSSARPHQFETALAILRAACGPSRLIVFARAVGSAEERIEATTLGEARAEMADMRTLVIVGSSTTRRAGRFVYTPRSAP